MWLTRRCCAVLLANDTPDSGPVTGANGLNLTSPDRVDLVVGRHGTAELLVQLHSLYPVSGYQIALAQIERLLLRNQHVVVGLHGS